MKKILTASAGVVLSLLLCAPNAESATKATLVSPAPGSTLTSSTAQFQWTAGSGVTGYWLSIGAATGGEEIYSVNQGTALSVTVTGLPTNGTRIYVRLWSYIGGWAGNFNDYSLTTYNPSATAPAELTAPAPGSTLTASTVHFQWTGGTSVSKYWLWAGTTPGGNDLYDQQHTDLSADVTGLPTNGNAIYVRLWSFIGSDWQQRNYTYTASGTSTATPAQMTAPAPGSTLTSSTVQFQWTGGSGVTDYWLSIGATLGGEDYHGASHGTSLSATVSGLPTNGSTVYVRLWSQINGTYRRNDYTYTATTPGVTPAPAQMTTPAPGSTLTASTVQFQWTGGTGVSQYWLYVGTTAGGNQLLDQDQGTSLSKTLSGLPTNGSTVYVRLGSRINGSWVYNDYTYTATTTGGGATLAQMTTPAPGSTLTSSTVQFQWTGGSGVTEYWLSIGATLGAEDYHGASHGTTLTATVSSLPTNGSTVYVRLWSLINGAWGRNDYTYTASTPGATPAPAQMTTPAPGSTLTASTVQFQWTGGTGVSQYWLYVGTTAGGNQLLDQDQGTSLSQTVSGLPTNGSMVYVRLGSRIDGNWAYRDYSYTATTTGGTGTMAQMTSPAPGSTLSASTVQFEWTGGSGVTEYWLSIGATLGSEDYHGATHGTSLTATVSGLPTNGSTIYVRLWSLINGVWKKNDYTYTASTSGTVSTAAAQLTTPTPGSTFTSGTVQFQWTAGTGVTEYWLSIGATLGGEEYHGATHGTSVTATVSGLPTNGGTVYVRLWSLINGVWKRNDYTYMAAH